MSDINDITSGLRIPGQIPLDSKLYCASEAILADLGTANNLAYTYYKGMIVYCVEEQSRFEWREVVGLEDGLMPSNFTYPANLVVNGVVYSSKVYNFFPALLDNNQIDQVNEIIEQYIMDNPGTSGGIQTVLSVGEDITELNPVLITGTNARLLFYTLDGGALLFLNSNTVPDVINNLQPASEIGICTEFGQTRDTLAFYNDKIVLRDTQNSKGIIYAGNYEDNFTARSLITKQHLESNVLPGKRYLALINQTGTNNPTAIVLYNNTGMTFSYLRTGAGNYTVTASGVLPITPVRVIPRLTPGYSDGINGIQYNNDGSTLQINTKALHTNPVINGTFTDDLIYNDVLEIIILN